MKVGAFLALLLLAAAPIAIQAQAYQCRVPQGPISVPAVTRDGPMRRASIAGYSLMLSWAPEYCRGRERNAADRVECSGANGRFGLILHGLWPESRDGSWPQWCPTARLPSPELVRRNLCLTPSVELIAHEWAKHGACMARTPDAYFERARNLWASLTLPDLDLLSKNRKLTAVMIRAAFTDANPSFRPDQVGLLVSERGWLQEVRFCYDARFRPRRCSKSDFGPPNASAVKIWRGL